MLEASRTRRGLAALLFLGALGLGIGAVPFQATSQLPVAYWNFDEATPPNVDSVGNVNATWTGGVTRSTTLPDTTFSYGNTASLAFSTAAAPDYASVANGSSLDTLQVNSYSVACWFRPSSLPAASTRYALVMKTGDNEGLSLRPENVFEFEHWSSDFAHLVNPGTWGQAPITAGTWYHVVGAWDGTSNTAFIFLNGVQADMRALSGGSGGANLAPTWYFGIANPGAAAAADQWQADGTLDDVRFYNYALNADQAMVLAAGVPAPTGLMATVTGGNVSLSWTAPPQAVTYTYNIGRRLAGTTDPYTIVNAAPISGTTTTDAPATAGNYQYVVYAVSVATSGPSDPATADVATTTPPVAPPVTPSSSSGTKRSGAEMNPCGGGSASLPDAGAFAAGLAFLLLAFVLRK